jgi:hypothetical protein
MRQQQDGGASGEATGTPDADGSGAQPQGEHA